MLFFLQLTLCSYLLLVSVYAKSEAEIRAAFIQKSIECSTQHPVSQEELQMMHDHKFPNTKNAKCLMACVFKKFDWVDNKGMFDVKSATEMIEKEHVDDAAKAENAKKLFDLCKKVNEEAVTDGEEGCDRSSNLAKCLLENSPKMGIPML